MKMNGRLLLIAALAAGASALTGCGKGAAESNGPGPTEDVGSVTLALQLGSGGVINTFSYSLTGPSTKSGTIDVSHSTTVSAVIGAVPAGSGYVISLAGATTDGTTTCTGTSGMFTVTARMTTAVTVAISCKQASTTGSVFINGTINICPAVDSVSANPPQGASIAVFASAHDSDAGPSPISYHWTTSSGTLSDANTQNPTLTCTAPGNVTLTVTATDSDPGCGDSFTLLVACPPDSALGDPAWVEIGANNQAIARLITPYSICPSITVDGVTSPMNLRVGPATEPIRPSTSDPVITATTVNTKASVFPVSTCELNLPPGALVATVAGQKLPLPKADPQRIVVLGDSGCRLAIGNPWQACGDPVQYPFPVVAAAAAAMKPDLVLHVGDYHYRENACPADQPQCQGSPWGYGWDVWAADLFQPGAPLLAAAPWIMVRGNHESCNRGGQGWYRFLDTNPYSSMKDCNDPAQDNVANYNDPYAVTSGDTQFIAFDSSNTPKAALAPGSLGFNNYTAEIASAAALVNPILLPIWANHHPILAYTAGTPVTGGNPGLLSVMSAAYPTSYFPPGIDLVMHGHVHDFQAISFSSGHPSTFIIGTGGDNLDAALPASITIAPAPNTTVGQLTYAQTFGFMVMDKVGPKNWSYTAYSPTGTVITRCTQVAAACTGCSDPTPGVQITCNPFGSL